MPQIESQEIVKPTKLAVPANGAAFMGKEQILSQANKYVDAADSASAEALLIQAIADDPANAAVYRSRLSGYRNAGKTAEGKALQRLDSG